MSFDLDDWSTHMMRAEVQLKAIEKQLLHKKYEGLQERATAAKEAIDKTMAWAARQGSNAGIDVVPILEDNMHEQKDSPIKLMMLSAIDEIKRLRSERKFWLKAGFDIGKTNAVEK
jgi:uncharacterized ferritin-like protein (DUF455 family)